MDTEKRVRELIEEKIADRPDLFVVAVKMQPNNNLLILLDGDKGISIDDCVAVSRYVGYRLEEEDAIGHAYTLQVSSPGVDTPLQLPRQYLKNIGRKLSVRMADGTRREGRLSGVTEDAVLLQEVIKEKGKKAVEVESAIPFGQITETKVLISFK